MARLIPNHGLPGLVESIHTSNISAGLAGTVRVTVNSVVFGLEKFIFVFSSLQKILPDGRNAYSRSARTRGSIAQLRAMVGLQGSGCSCVLAVCAGPGRRAPEPSCAWRQH